MTATIIEVAMDYFKVLLPIIITAVLAVAAVFIVKKYADKDPEKTYMIEGLILGMMFGAGIAVSFEHLSFGTPVGVVLGMTIGFLIDKKKK
ncbi:hypothetical protein BSR29_04895 [Boudabousia liubingyangii]|uniref:DUF2700 domain-containing protein n=1 Tax=Boudabousia liubingyangii TaxID=1921764 RepID=A0A1Q5PLB3_9ACTO|nr:hypothetical protein BSR29_04895 [Boudabousia liubingyangii]